jgi:hypothetical protein
VWLDWMRGLAVLIMIEAHVLDSWTRAADRSGTAFGWSIILGGMGAPLFLFLAGVAIPLSAGSKLRRTGDGATAARLVMRRGLEIFLLALLFRLQAWLLGWAPAHTLLRVDILNIMGPAIAGTAFLWSLARRPASQTAARSARGVSEARRRVLAVRALPVGRLCARRRDAGRLARQRAIGGGGSTPDAPGRRRGARARRDRFHAVVPT